MNFLFKLFRKIYYVLLLPFHLWLNKVQSLWSAKFNFCNLITTGWQKHHVPVKFNGCGTVVLGNAITFGYKKAGFIGDGHLVIQARKKTSRISIGEGTHFSNNISMIAQDSISIGKDCLIGFMTSIIDSDFHGIAPDQRKKEGLSAPVTIGNSVFIGAQCTILKGVSIGDNSVIAANSVVTKSFPENVIIAGNPAKKIGDV